MLLVYTHKITPRLSYIFKQFFVRILKIKVSFTTDVADFIAFNGPKLTYTFKPLGNELFIKCHDLLYEQGVNDIDINIAKWKDTIAFFNNNLNGIIPFDVFAASFYLLSRYEEYLPYVQDENERYPASESLAYQNKFLDKPVVDIWAMKFLEILKDRFPNYNFEEKRFEVISTIDVANVFAYKQKGIIRNFGGFVKDIFTFRIDRVIGRFLVLLRFRKDPFDTYDEILKTSKSNNIKTIFFFLIGDYTTYDRNISSSNNVFRSLIKSVSDYVDFGLHPSYFTMTNSDKLKKEVQLLESIVNQPIKKSRQHYLRLKLPETYQNLIDLEVTEDHSMGYAKEFGFRASTCTPFYFYDLDFEIQTPLKVFPFAIMDSVLRDQLGLVPAVAKKKISNIKKEVKKVKGTFITVFHNESLSDEGEWKGWKKVYESIF